jgi:hypothetical protein
MLEKRLPAGETNFERKLMKRASAVLLVLMTAALPFDLQGQTDWIKYNSPEGRYSVLLPAEPKISSQEAAASTGEKFTQYMAASEDSIAVYMVGYFDVAPNMTFSFEKARDGFISAVKGTLLSEKVISLDGYPGREANVTANGGSGAEYLILVRFYQVEKRIYVIQFIVAKSADAAISAGKSAKYFNSFQVTTAR